MSKTLKEFKKRGYNKWERQQLKKQKELKRGRYTKQEAMAMSGDAGRPMYYMVERDDYKEIKQRIQQ